MKFWHKIADTKSENFKALLALIIIPILALLINIILSEVQDNFGFKIITISVIFITVVLLGLMFILNKLTNELICKNVMPRFEVTLSQPVIEPISNYGLCEGSIITDAELAKFEKNCTCEEIWFISNDLTTELDGGLYADVVPYNLSRGIKYKVFVANNKTVAMRIEQLKRKNNNSQNIEYYILDDDFFFLVAKFDFTIYDPYKTASTGKIGYIGLDLSSDDDLFAVKVTDNLVDAIASKLLEYIHERKLNQA